jgi:hypothetical protein
MLANWNTDATIHAQTLFVAFLDQIFMKLLTYVDKAGFYLQIKKSKERVPNKEPAKLILVPKRKKLT